MICCHVHKCDRPAVLNGLCREHSKKTQYRGKATRGDGREVTVTVPCDHPDVEAAARNYDEHCAMAYLKDAIQKIHDAEERFEELGWNGYRELARQSRGIIERIRTLKNIEDITF